MRIQHNIMAMNAYRNYNTNTSALSKNLEKLSSGYKINRAGDDAAGLAISEKMRAQITGLNAAQKNVKDGISLVKTAEGAMQEIQDMLNRMDYLATQSANGTYQDEVDREALQKEVDQLKSEIDRIADSANFNGIKLLDGSLDASGNSLKVAQSAAKAAASETQKMKAALDAAKNMEVAGKDTAMGDDVIKALFADKAGAGDTVATAAGTKTFLETDAVPTGEVGFVINLDGVDYVMGGTDTEGIKLQIGQDNTSITLTQTEMKTYISADLKTGDKVTGEQLAKAIAKKYNAAAGTAITADGANGDKYKIKADGTKLTFAAVDNQTTRPNRHFNAKITSDNNAAGAKTDAVASKYVSGALSSGGGGTVTKDEEIKVTVAYKYIDDDGTEKTGSKEVSYTTKANAAGATDDTATTIAKGLVDAINNDADLSKYFVASYTTGDKITLEAQTAGTTTKGSASVTDLTVTGAGTASKMELADITEGDQVKGADEYTAGLGNSYVNPGTESIVMAGEDGKDLLASTVLKLTADHLKNGALIQLGNEKYRIALGENSAYKGENGVYNGDEKVVALDDANATIAQIASKLSDVAKDNDVFTVSHVTTDGSIGLKQLASAKQGTDMTTMDNFASYVKISTVTTAGDQSIKDKAIEEAQANYDAAVEKQAAADAKVKELAANPGKALQLQIGDTSDTYNQLKVSVGDMHTSALNIGDLDIGTAEKASGAIQTIKDAINNVSSVRGDLGAYQNRLEHTANNLSVMAENIQDAESTIRDTDVAEEMMAYTKNNILIQSAQAMLAQANAVPQGVLQLLG